MSVCLRKRTCNDAKCVRVDSQVRHFPSNSSIKIKKRGLSLSREFRGWLLCVLTWFFGGVFFLFFVFSSD